MFPYTNQTSFSKMSCNYLYNHDSEHDQNPNSTTPQEEEEDPPFSLHNFPSPFLDDNQLFFSHIFPHHHHHHQQLMAADQNLEANISTTEEISSNTNTTTATTADHHHHPSLSEKVAPKLKRRSTNNNKNKGPTQRKSGKKDRHSKIYTAQGLRDRRMRLSLQIARKFFDLQDMLGFDKASKTIDWLFSKSRKAIKQLSCTTNRMVPQINNTMLSSTSSECEVESEEIMRKVVTPSEGENFSNEKKPQKLRKGNSIAKEFRDKARARARERTREKMMIRCLEKSNASYNSIQLASAGNPNSLFETREESMSCLSQDSHSSLHHQLANVGIIDNFLGTTASSSAAASCSIFDYQKNDAIFSGGLDSYSNKFLGFLGNWDLNSNNSAMASNMVLTGKAPTSVFMENSSYHHFQSQNQAD